MTDLISQDKLERYAPLFANEDAARIAIGRQLVADSFNDFELAELAKQYSRKVSTLKNYRNVVAGTMQEWQRPEVPFGVLTNLVRLPQPSDRAKVFATLEADAKVSKSWVGAPERARRAVNDLLKRETPEPIASTEDDGEEVDLDVTVTPGTVHDKQAFVLVVVGKVTGEVNGEAATFTLPTNLEDIQVHKLPDRTLITAKIIG